MGAKQQKRINKAVKGHIHVSYRIFFNRLCDLPWLERWKACRRIMRRKKFENPEAR